MTKQERGRIVTPNVNVVQRFYSLLATGDVAGMSKLFAPKIEWTEAERFPYFGGTWGSFQAVVDNLFAPIGRDWDRFAANATRFIAENDSVVSFGRYRGISRATGQTLDAPFAHLWTIRDGLIAAFVQYTDTAKVLEAAGPGPHPGGRQSATATARE